MQQFRILSMCPTSRAFNAVYFDKDDRDKKGDPTMFYLPVAAFGVVETASKKGMAGPLVPHGESGLVPGWLLSGYLDCAPEDETELDNDEHAECWLERWREEHPETVTKKKTKKRSSAKTVRKPEPVKLPDEEEEEEDEEEEESDDDDDDDDDDPPAVEVHLGAHKR